ncbi:pre-mRNA-processing factor 39-2-like isoform X2 [Carex rostrata]
MLDSASTDFDALVSLIREVEHSSLNDIGAVDLIYDKFLLEFPLCYAFWVKYGAHKLRLCEPNEVVQVYERAVQALTFSVDLWCNYCTFGALTFDDPSDIRRLFERALSFVGKDYLCYKIWDKYIEFEYSHKQWHRLANIYILILKFPTKKLHAYYESFKKLASLLEEEASIQGIEFVSLSNQDGETVKNFEISDILSVIQGFTDANSHKMDTDMIKKYLWAGEEMYRRSCEIEKNIICYENNITRHYFHVKPLDDSQLENWHRYLDFVETQGDLDWMVKLSERCLIPCANYPEFWIRYMDFVHAQGGKEIANNALGRSPPFFQKKVPAYRMYCAMMKEELGNSLSSCSLLLHDFNRFSSNYIKDIYREANLEKRKGNIKGAFELYENEIEYAVEKKNVEVASSLYINFAQFTFAATGSRDAAREVFLRGIKQMPCNSLIKGLIQFEMIHGGTSQIPILDSIISNVIEPRTDESMPLCYEDREEISMLFFDFVDLYGKPAQIRKVWARHCVLFPKESRNAYSLTDSTSNKRAKLEKNESILGKKEVILQPNLESIVLPETQNPESKTNFSVPAPENNLNSNNSIDHNSDVEKTDPVRANPESETIDTKPDESLQISPIQGECSKSEVELGQNRPVSNPDLARSNNLIQTSQPSFQTFPTGALAQSLNGGVQSGQVCPSQMWQHNQNQLQQMYYCLQLQQQQLQQQVLQKNQLQSNHSSPSNNSLQEKQQQLQQQMIYYQQMYQMYLQQSMQVQQQQQQHWYQFQQQQMALANAPHSQDKEQLASSHPSTPIK